jgi:hypothetical protein
LRRSPREGNNAGKKFKELLFLKKKKQKDFLLGFSEWAVPQALPN